MVKVRSLTRTENLVVRFLLGLIGLRQGCQTLHLEGHCSAEISSNLDPTHLSGRSSKPQDLACVRNRPCSNKALFEAIRSGVHNHSGHN